MELTKTAEIQIKETIAHLLILFRRQITAMNFLNLKILFIIACLPNFILNDYKAIKIPNGVLEAIFSFK